MGAFKKHLDGVVGCESRLTPQWNDTVVCDAAQAQIRSILFNKIMPYEDFKGLNMKVFRLNPTESNFAAVHDNQDAFEEAYEMKIKSGDIVESVASIFATGEMYNLHWRYGIDFKFMGIQPSPYWTEDDKSVVLRFNYTAVREKY